MGMTVAVCGGDETFWSAVRKVLEPGGNGVFLIPDPRQLPRFMSYFVPDMVIIDFDSPRGEGPAALRFVRNTRSGLSLPIMIALTEPVELRGLRFSSERLTKFISKPVDLAEFHRAVEEFSDCDAVGRGGEILGDGCLEAALGAEP